MITGLLGKLQVMEKAITPKPPAAAFVLKD
jgi:hypothetical protein